MAQIIKSMIKFILKGLFVYIALGFIVFVISISVLIFSPDPGFKGRKILLQQTNFPELLKAGRELISKTERKEYTVNSGGYFAVPDDANIPEAIESLRYKLSGIKRLGSDILIDNSGFLEISFAGNRETGWFGLYIFPEEFIELESNFTGPDYIVLLPGMLYFDDAHEEFPKLRIRNENYIKKNKSLNNGR